MSDSTNDKSATKKEIRLTLDERTIKRAGDALNTMKEEFSKRTQKRPAEELVRQYIDNIDELSRLGASLQQIFVRLDKAVHLGISMNSFAVYVRRIRKETGSDQYNQRSNKKKIKEDNSNAAPVTLAETTINDMQATQQETSSVENWNCVACTESAVRKASTKRPGFYFWQCQKCGANYADNNGELMNMRI